MQPRVVLLACVVTAGSGLDVPTSAEELHAHYSDIFAPTFVLDRSRSLGKPALSELFAGFCPVSGSPVRSSPYNRYRVTLPHLEGGTATGFFHHCCWPCVCDAREFLHADSLTIRTADGSRRLTFAVIGDPCQRESGLAEIFVQPFGAPAVTCRDGRLVNATRSENGGVIVGLLHDARLVAAIGPIDGRPTPGRMSQDEAGGLFQDQAEVATFHPP
ncbi:hypothetical protein T492DRAFT_876612 [Pavlovales sp. CCMP2436]|nr:hypothetical protein T492DRAFT_876612 [Pavlovales sp. CCMP2436]